MFRLIARLPIWTFISDQSYIIISRVQYED